METLLSSPCQFGLEVDLSCYSLRSYIDLASETEQAIYVELL